MMDLMEKRNDHSHPSHFQRGERKFSKSRTELGLEVPRKRPSSKSLPHENRDIGLNFRLEMDSILTRDFSTSKHSFHRIQQQSETQFLTKLCRTKD